MPGNWLNRLLVLTILLSGSLNPSIQLMEDTCDDESRSSPDGQSEPALRVSVSDIEASLIIGQEAREFMMRLIIAVDVENRSGDAMMLAREQFQLLIDGEPAEVGSVDSHQSFQRSTLQPGESAEGWLGFGSIVYDGHKPSIVLRWRPSTGDSADVKPVDVDLHAEVLQRSGFQQTRLGPEGCLLQITTNRDLDVLSIWPVEDMLKIAAAEKIARVVFSSAREQPPVIHEEFNLWLSGMIDTRASVNDPNLRFMPRVNPPFPRSGFRFRQITVGGLKEAMNHRFGMYRHAIAVLSSPEAAVADALTPVYRHVATVLAVADLQHPNPGVRRAARAGVVDRLTPEQASVVIEEALQGSPELQIEIAGYLNVIPGERSVDALRVLSLSDHAQVSQTALRSLIENPGPATESAMSELWRIGRTRPELQNQILIAIIQLNNERWTPLVADYVADKIEAAARGSSDPGNVDNSPAVASESEYEQPVDSFVATDNDSSTQQSLLGSSLGFLHRQQHSGTREALRRHLLQLSDPALQDIALTALVDARDVSDDSILRECLDRRIRSEQISDSVRAAAIQLPSPQWTEMFLNDLKFGVDGNHQALSANALLRCASATQLDQIIDGFDSLPENVRQQTLRYLVTLDHPRWKSLAKKQIEAPLPQSSGRNTSQRADARSIATETIQLLASDASEESIAMLTDRLARAIEEIGTSEDVPLESRLFVHRLIESISMFAHPECRRSLNRAARCGNHDLRKKVAKQSFDALQRSPAGNMLLDRLRNITTKEPALEDNEDTIAFFDDCIEADPWLTEIYIRRSSVLMHLNRFDETMEDLKTASRLSPENMDVESMIALCRIRLGDTDAGLKYAEELVVAAPRDLSSLYNGACSYSRALENPNVSDEEKQRYGDRAIELIRLTFAIDFGDFEHLLNDEDLVALHTHPEWSAVVEETRKMHAEILRKPQE